jgi:hypothetical protein
MGELVVVVLCILALLGLTLLGRRVSLKFRSIPAFRRLYGSIGLSVEEGTRLHVSLGRGGLLTGRGGASLAGLSMLRYLTERTSVGDQPPVATTGEPALVLLTQDTLQAGYQAAGAEDMYQPTTGRLTGETPFSYAAGVMPVISDEHISANLLIGDFGPEVALITDAATRAGSPTMGGTDDIAGQAVLYAAAQEPLIGEEIFAAPAYLGSDPAHAASLALEDILRWLLIAFLLGGAALKMIGVI